MFLTRRDCEPTNNESERALRPSVIFRNATNGFRSEWGAKVYADLCSIVETGRRNGRCAHMDVAPTPRSETPSHCQRPPDRQAGGELLPIAQQKPVLVSWSTAGACAARLGIAAYSPCCLLLSLANKSVR